LTFSYWGVNVLVGSVPAINRNVDRNLDKYLVNIQTTDWIQRSTPLNPL
jgi:hypothetical protein